MFILLQRRPDYVLRVQKDVALPFEDNAQPREIPMFSRCLYEPATFVAPDEPPPLLRIVHPDRALDVQHFARLKGLLPFPRDQITIGMAVG